MKKVIVIPKNILTCHHKKYCNKVLNDFIIDLNSINIRIDSIVINNKTYLHYFNDNPLFTYFTLFGINLYIREFISNNQFTLLCFLSPNIEITILEENKMCFKKFIFVENNEIISAH